MAERATLEAQERVFGFSKLPYNSCGVSFGWVGYRLSCHIRLVFYRSVGIPSCTKVVFLVN